MAVDLNGISKDIIQARGNRFLRPLPKRLTGWGFPYEIWPQELKNEYAYNPKMAKKLLADAGYPNGFKRTLSLNFGRYAIT